MSIYFLFFVFIFVLLVFLYFIKRMQKDSLKVLLFELMEKNNRLFLDMAGGYFEKYEKSAKSDLEKRQDSIERSLNPVKETLSKLEKYSLEIERKRISS